MSNYELKFRFTSALEKTAHVTYNEGINVKRKKCKRERLMISEGSRLEYVEAGTYLRMHVHPKRSPRCYEIDWKSRIIVVTDSSYVVLEKLAGTMKMCSSVLFLGNEDS
ncbi:hypothetical protein F2Q69_00034876 [Brassica cretica]|uniref:Uncharacterized protein n=2 Tax=Brassica cretica TaxID=69181 RepID=A0ABQ7BCA9_BRACR|nr:hypothetical protein DY000_02039437 [Brassica cretica]KAF3603060.1 hypothetical protein F2Q69_00034876 [Brassica cretica]